VSWFGKMTFGSLGLFLGGPLGAIIGVTLGHHFVDKKQNTVRECRAASVRAGPGRLFVCIFLILGKLQGRRSCNQ